MNVSETNNMESAIFTSMGQAWQWAIDVAELHPDWITMTAHEIGLSELSLIEIYKRLLDQGKRATDIREELKAQAEKKAEDDKAEYARITAGYNLQLFREEIAESANLPRYSTGFNDLDQALGGGLFGGLYIIGAVPSLGKTTFVLQMADQLALQGRDVLIISLEMDRKELTAKSISRTTFQLAKEYRFDGMAKTARDILDGSRYKDYNPAEIDLIDDAYKRYGQFADHLYIIEGRGSFTVNEIRAAVENHLRITGCSPIVIIDYIQKITPINDKAQDKTNIDIAVRELFWISRDYDLPVIGISSFNRQNYNGRPGMTAFKESGSIEYDADVLLGMSIKGPENDGYDALQAKRKDPREIELAVLKNRMGRVGGVLKFDYYAAYNSFIEDGFTAE